MQTATEFADYVTQGDADQTGYYVTWLQSRVRSLLNAEPHRRAVKALAEALLRRETIKYAEARRIIEEAIRT